MAKHGMVDKTYSLSEMDAEKLVSYAVRYKKITIVVDETNSRLNVYTSWDNELEATSLADYLPLHLESNTTPGMPADEYNRRVKGQFTK